MDGALEEIAQEWASNSTEIMSLALVDHDGREIEFSPVFTYPIYGETETIYGFKDLSIQLKFDSYTFLPYISVNYSKKLLESTDDPEKVILEYLPESTISKDYAKWNELRKQTDSFKIPGELIEKFTDTKGAEFSVYKSTFADEDTVKFHSRIQILILLFIEAGSYIDVTDDHWEIYFLYQTSPSKSALPEEVENFKPSFAGFSTVYKYFWYKDGPTHDAETQTNPYLPNLRKRISQFVVLPIHQKKRVGSYFYKTLFEIFLKEKLVREVSVEDPSEAFDDLRDRIDLTRLGENNTINEILDKFLLTRNNEVEPTETSKGGLLVIKDKGMDELTLEWIESKRLENKMTPRQFERCIEMILLHYIDDKNPEQAQAAKRFRLLVKRRLYLRNKDALDDMSLSDRRSKLEETFQALKDDYWRIIQNVKFPTDKRKPAGNSDLKNKGKKKQKLN